MPYKPVDRAIKVILGPLIDDTDFKAREESIAYNQAGMEIDIILEKTDGTVTTTAVTPTAAGDYDWAHTDQGYYELELPASGGASYNNDEEGIIRVVGYCTGVLPFGSVPYDVISQNAYDSLVADSDVLHADLTQMGGVAQSATDLKDLADTGYDSSTHKVQGVVLADTATTVTNRVTADMTYIHGTALTETAGQLAGRFVDFFDQASAGYSVATALSSFKATGFSTLDAAGVRAAVGLASANLDVAVGGCSTAAKLLAFVQLLARSDAAIATDNATELGEINADGGSGAGDFSNQTDAEEAVRDKVVAILTSDTYAEPGAGAPAATASLKDKIGYMYKWMRNKLEQTVDARKHYNDAGDTVDQEAAVSDDGTTFTRDEVGAAS